jgi:EmrB/QacA subfamily drug resistance transporter
VADAHPPRSFRQSLLAMLGISLVLMLSALDQTVVGNALPSIVADLHGFALYAWVATGYLLASVVTIPIFGRLGDYYGRKPFVLAATAVFTLASAGCALTGSMPGLVVARVLQGIGGGMLVGTAFACVPELFPDTRQRLRWQMLLSVAFSVVNAVGPLLGGMLTQYAGWRSVFWLNLPLGLLAWCCVWRYLPWFKVRHEQPVRLDWLGALLIVATLGALQWLVEWLPRPDSLLPKIVLALVGLAALALLRWQQPRVSHPLLPPALFADGSLRGLFLLSVLAGAIMFALLFYMPLLFQAGYGYSLKDASLLITPLALCITLGAILNGRIVARLRDPGRLPMAGFGLLLLATLGIAICGRHATFALLFTLMFGAGLGLGLILMNLTLFTQTVASRQHLGIATALLQSLRLVGGMLGTALVGMLVSWWYRRQMRPLVQQHDGVPGAADLLDPQWLLTPMKLSTGASGHFPGALEAARAAMIQAVDIASGVLALLAALALWQVARLPRIALR